MNACRSAGRRCDACGLERGATGVWQRGVWHAASYLGWREVQRVALADVDGRCLCQQCRHERKLVARKAERERLRTEEPARAQIAAGQAVMRLEG